MELRVTDKWLQVTKCRNISFEIQTSGLQQLNSYSQVQIHLSQDIQISSKLHATNGSLFYPAPAVSAGPSRSGPDGVTAGRLGVSAGRREQ